MSNENSINTVPVHELVSKIDVGNLSPLEEAELASKALAKIQQYQEFYQKLSVGAELSAHSVKETKRLRRYMRHRLDTVREAA